jgi:hypothetical protein
MKKLHFLLLFCAFAGALMFNACIKADDCSVKRTFTEFIPIYKTAAEIRGKVVATTPRDLKNPGKIYSYGKYLFINELKEGFHIIDNSNPSSPKKVSFVAIPGNVDMAVKDNVLYADNYTDLLAIDISDAANPKLMTRLESVYQNQFSFDQARGFLVEWQPTPRTTTIDCSDPNFNAPFFSGGGNIFVATSNDVVRGSLFSSKSAGISTNSTGQVSVGTGGSFARFTIVDDYLYVVSQWELTAFFVKNAAKPIRGASINAGWNIETIFPLKDKLFLGSQSGMFIYDIAAPGSPALLGQFSHARACDPVFVDGNTAYVTLRDGTRCNSFTNQLDIVDVADLRNPKLLRSYPMKNPHGLSVLNKKLYLCDGADGLKVYDIADINAIDKNLLSHINTFFGYDVIALEDNLIMVIGENGLFQFDATDAKKLKQLSMMPVVK